MDWAYYTFGGDKVASPEIIPQVAVEAERIGLDSSWSWERLIRPTVPIALGGAGGAVRDAPEVNPAVAGAGRIWLGSMAAR